MTTSKTAEHNARITGSRRKLDRKRPAWMERPNPLTQAVKAIALGVSVLLVIIPFWSVLATSLADQKTINRSGGGMVMWTSTPSLAAYEAILSGGVVTRAMIISILITVVGTLLSLATTAGLAYWLSRKSVGSRPMVLLVLGAVLFTPGLIPNYLMVKELHLLDSWWSLILPVMVNAFNVIVMRAFFQELPQELFESAAIDGASNLTILAKIILPLSKAVLAVIGLFYAVAYWNAFFNALLYLQTNDKWPIALVLRTYVVNQTSIGGDQVGTSAATPPQLPMQMAILVVALIPILIVYPFLQRHFAKGVMIGAVKG